MNTPSFPRPPSCAIVIRPDPGWWIRPADDTPTDEEPTPPSLIEASTPDTDEYTLEEITDTGWPE